MKKSLVVYFSHNKENYVKGKIVYLDEGNTKVVAKKIQSIMECDIFEIQPLHEYPSDYHECTEVAKLEQKQNVRPKIKNMVSCFQKYETIYLGFPNWWGTMPMVVQTFLEEYPFENKTIYPFCTHEGSGMGNSVEDIHQLCPQSHIEKPLAIRGSQVHECDELLKNWLLKE